MYKLLIRFNHGHGAIKYIPGGIGQCTYRMGYP